MAGNLREQIAASVSQTFDRENYKTLQENVRQQVQAESAAGREELQKQQAQINEELAWVGMLTVIINGRRLVDNVANRKEVWSFLQLDEVPSGKWFKKTLEDQPELINRLAWEAVVAPEEKKRADQRRETEMRLQFSILCRQHNLSECESNYRLWLERESLNGLALATDAELAQWESEAEEARQLKLLTADKNTLRRMAQEERTNQPSEAQRQLDRQLEAERQRDAATGFPPMPRSVTAFNLREASSEYLKNMIRKYGAAQVTARLNEK